MRRIMGRGHKVDIQRTLRLKLGVNLRQTPDRYLCPRLAVGNDGVLAVHAAKRAPREEHRARAMRATDRRLNKLKKEGKKVLLVAGDTFRAGAIEQIEEWGKRINIDVVSTKSKDPSAAVYDGVDKGIKENYDVILIDTAGRLQNKVNLMNELSKMNSVIKKLIPNAPHETLLVVDATSGQNGISQAKAFSEVTDITGIVLTKLDGTAKGGIVLAIKEEVNIPVKYVGLGEQEDDLEAFDIEKYIYGLFKDL